MIKPLAYLKEWEVDGEKRCRVDLHSDCEPWLRAYGPRITSLYARSDALEPPVQLLKDFEITPEMEAEMMRPGKFELVFPQQRMEPDTSPLTHQEIFSAVHHHAAEIVRLTAAVPAQCSEPASNVMIVNHFPEETRVAPSLACRYCPARFMTAWEHEVHEKEHAVKSRVSE